LGVAVLAGFDLRNCQEQGGHVSFRPGAETGGCAQRVGVHQLPAQQHDTSLAQVAESFRWVSLDEYQVGGLAGLDGTGRGITANQSGGTIVAAANASAGVKPACW
jgi:hypothetical protein